MYCPTITIFVFLCFVCSMVGEWSQDCRFFRQNDYHHLFCLSIIINQQRPWPGHHRWRNKACCTHQTSVVGLCVSRSPSAEKLDCSGWYREMVSGGDRHLSSNFPCTSSLPSQQPLHHLTNSPHSSSPTSLVVITLCIFSLLSPESCPTLTYGAIFRKNYGCVLVPIF